MAVNDTRLNIRDLAHLSHRIGESEAALLEVAGEAESLYRARPLVRNGKTREIEVPKARLKSIQSRIYSRLLAGLPYPPELHGGIRKRSVLTNVRLHCGRHALLVLDVRNFFPSISRSLVYSLFADHLGCSKSVARTLSHLVCHKDRLPQGTSTSPAIANLVMVHYILPQIMPLCRDKEVTVSAFVDDCAFSADDSRLSSIRGQIVKAIERAGFAVHPLGTPGKNQYSHEGQRMEVNGLTINRKPNVRRRYRDNLRAEAHRFRLECTSLSEGERDKRWHSLAGKIAYVESVNPCAARRVSRVLAETVAQEPNWP